MSKNQVGVEFWIGEFFRERGTQKNGRFMATVYHLGFGTDDDGKWGLLVSASEVEAGGVELPFATNSERAGDAGILWTRKLVSAKRGARIHTR